MAIQLLRRWFPLPADYEAAGPSREELRPICGRWRIVGLILFFVGLAVWAPFWWLVLDTASRWISPQFGPGIYHLYASGAVFFFPAIPLGIAASGLSVDWIGRRLFKDRYPDFVRYDNLMAGFDGKRAAKPIIMGVGLLSLVMVALALSWHVVFRKDVMMFHFWCGLGTSQKLYADVKEIRTAPQLRAPSGKLVNRREYVVEFADGTTWSTNFQPAELPPQKKKNLLEFVSKKSGKPIRELQILE